MQPNIFKDIIFNVEKESKFLLKGRFLTEMDMSRYCHELLTSLIILHKKFSVRINLCLLGTPDR